MRFLERLPKVAAIAHRGGAALWPENTLLAFESVVRQFRPDVIETDLHVSKDGVLVVSHDPTVDRRTNGKGAVADLTLKELQALDAGPGARIPSFEEVLTQLPNQAFNIELKPDVPGLELEFARVLRKHGAVDRVCIGSEQDVVAERLVKALPDACHFYPAGAALKFAMGVWGQAPLEADPRYHVLAIPYLYDGAVVANPAVFAAAAKFDVPVFVWVVDDPETMRALAREGARGIMTDRPDLLHAALKA
jgi:glycerophosphoryl diester phosphodiesterase